MRAAWRFRDPAQIERVAFEVMADKCGEPLNASHPWYRKMTWGRSKFPGFDQASGVCRFLHVYLGFYPANPAYRQRTCGNYSVCGRPLSYRAIRRWCPQ